MTIVSEDMSNFLCLSKYVLIPVLSEWLQIEDILNLDTSLTSRQRRMWYSLIADDPKSFERMISAEVRPFPLTPLVLDWMDNHCLFIESIYHWKCTNLSLWELGKSSDLAATLTLLAPSVLSLQVENFSFNHFDVRLLLICCEVLKSARSLTNISFVHCLEGTSQLLEAIVSNTIVSLHIDDQCMVSEDSLKLLFARQPLLREVTAQQGRVTIGSLRSLAAPLTFMDIDFDADEDGDVPFDLNSIIPHCAAGFKGLVCRGVTDSVLRCLVSLGSSTLTQLHIHSQVCSGEALAHLFKSCPTLTDVDLSYLCVNATAEDFSPAWAAMAGLSGLRSVDLRGINHATTESLAAIFARCSGLEKVWLGCGAAVTDGTLALLGVNCPRLQVLGLELASISEIGIAMVLNGCPKLSRLRLVFHQDRFEEVLAGLHSRGHQLTTLDLNGTECTDAMLQELFPICPNLTDVDIGAISGITVLSVFAVVENCLAVKKLAFFNYSITLTGELVDVIVAKFGHCLASVSVFVPDEPLEEVLVALGKLVVGLPKLRRYGVPKLLYSVLRERGVAMHPNLLMH